MSHQAAPCHAAAAALLAALVSSLSVPAGAVDRVTYPYRGVMHMHRMLPGTVAHVVTVDLSSPDVDVVSTIPRDRFDTVSTFAREQHAQIAINANFFDDGSASCGLAVGDHHVWRGSSQSNCGASIAFGQRNGQLRAEVFDSFGWWRSNPLSWASQVLTGKPILLLDGRTYFDPHEPIGMYRTHPRTAIGVAADGRTLVIAVIDGRRRDYPGMTSLEMIPLLEEFAVRDAINLDGGGSSALYIAAEGGVVNRPSDGHERSVLNHFGVRITSAWNIPNA
ncbi:MAG: phosphodiester glycosidase family protein [Deltaproteobacteria bacterium]|nr:phosphodiester glycosidase family protein [Deltaproteobacteria bacterium]